MSVFNTEPTQAPAQIVPETDKLTTMLAEIKNEQGEAKYGSLEDAMKALAHSQAYIPELKTQLQEREAELANLRLDMAKQQGVQETLSRFTTAPQEPQVDQTPVQEPTQDIEALVSRQFSAFTQRQAEEANLKSVDDAVLSMYGEKAGDFISTKSKELGLTPQALESMAKTSPKAAMALLGIEGKPRNVSGVNAGSYRTDGMAPKTERVQKPAKSLMGGAASKDVAAFMQAIREEVYSDFGVQS